VHTTGASYTTTTYTNYVAAVGAKRTTATPGMMLTLDASFWGTRADPVRRVECQRLATPGEADS
jgi:hypothetical protein